MEQETNELNTKIRLVNGIDITCGNKKSYDNEKSALKKAKKLTNATNKNFETYECPFCHFWHVDNPTPIEIANMYKNVNLSEIPKYATFFGGAINDTTTKEYADSILIGELLTRKGYTVKNGGYRGLMEAVSKGATSVKNGKAIGFTCESFGSVKGNEYLTETIPCEDIYDRLRALITNSELFIVQAGGIGTLSELSLLLDIVRKRNVKPKIFILGENWDYIMQAASVVIPGTDFDSLIFCDGFDEFKEMFNKC